MVKFEVESRRGNLTQNFYWAELNESTNDGFASLQTKNLRTAEFQVPEMSTNKNPASADRSAGDRIRPPSEFCGP